MVFLGTNTVAIITWLGTAASFLGVWLSFEQAKKSKAAASIAEKIKSQLLNHDDATTLARLQAAHSAVLECVGKYAASAPSSTLGVSVSSDAEVVQRYIGQLREHKDYFDDSGSNEAENLCSSLEGILDKLLKSETEPLKLQKYGREMSKLISGFSSLLKKRLERTRSAVQ